MIIKLIVILFYLLIINMLMLAKVFMISALAIILTIGVSFVDASDEQSTSVEPIQVLSKIPTNPTDFGDKLGSGDEFGTKLIHID